MSHDRPWVRNSADRLLADGVRAGLISSARTTEARLLGTRAAGARTVGPQSKELLDVVVKRKAGNVDSITRHDLIVG